MKLFGSIKHFFKLVELYFNAQSDSKIVKTADILFVCKDLDRSEIYDGRFFSRVLGPIEIRMKDYGFKTVSCVLPSINSISLGQKNIYGNPFTIQRAYIRAYFKDILISFFFFKGYRRFRTELFKEVIIKTQCKLVFVIESLGELNAASKMCNVKVIEVMHSFGYFNLPSFLYKLNDADLPSGFLCFDRTTYSMLCREFVNRDCLVLKTKFDYYFNSMYFSNNTQLVFDSFNFPIKVVFSCQWGYNGDHGEHEYFENILSNGLIPDIVLNCILQSENRVLWYIRLHPVQKQHLRIGKVPHWLKLLSSLGSQKNVIVDLDKDFSIFSLSKSVNAHITMSSFTSYDFAALGIKTLALCPTLNAGGINESFFQDLKNLGFVELGDLKNIDVLEWLENCQRVMPCELLYNSDLIEDLNESNILDVFSN
jgi:hypothetical protein